MNRTLRGASLILLLTLILSSFAFAEPAAKTEESSRRGLVTSAQCPFSCKDLGLSSSDCREWKQGSKCMVEDFTQAAGHRSMFRVKDSDGVQMRSKAAQAESRGALAAPDFNGRRGLITSSTCPYTCKMAGLSSETCRESRQGNTCTVEDFMQPAGHRSLIRVPN